MPFKAGVRFLLAGCALAFGAAYADYVNFESSQVHPIGLTPSRTKLLAVNTPDGLLEVFSVSATGSLVRRQPIPVGVEPVSVIARTDSEAWVVNRLSDNVSIVDLSAGTTTATLPVGDEPTDVVFAAGKAFVAVAQEDAVKVFDLSNLAAPPTKVDLFGRKTRALAVSADGTKVYAVVLESGNQTTVINANIIAANDDAMDTSRMAQLGLNNIACTSAPPAYPPLPPGISRNPALLDPAPPAQPQVALIVKWNAAAGAWKDDAGQNWNTCLPYRLPDHDLFVIDAASPGAPTFVDHLGTTLFDVSVNPASGKIYVPNTDARNFIRFEHPELPPGSPVPAGVQGHMVENQLSIVNPAAGYAVTEVDLNTHIDRTSNPATNLSERMASISQPGMMVWNSLGTYAYLTAIGSRKLFRVDGSCSAGSCIFGPTRGTPVAVEVGEGPTGVALDEAVDRLYVLNRFSNSIAVVQASTMVKTGEIALHDPSSTTVKTGRRLLYDGITSSAHGDAACSSCHISGDRDGLAWDLGNPEGDFVAYGTPGDNVRFVAPNPILNAPVECPTPQDCASHAGFDPQKGPMTTQTLRGMLEPLHWRGDRATMNAFNPAFVGLMGAQDIGPIDGKPAGLSAAMMELFRQFSLGITFPPNPYRNVDDTLPNAVVTIPGHPQSGNPTVGQSLFLSTKTDRNLSTCVSCHAPPFGTAGGKLGGINPGDPSTAEAALFTGQADGQIRHNDVKIPHMRNLYEKFGPTFGTSGSPTDSKGGFGVIHDGSVPDVLSFLSQSLFTITAQNARDLQMFLLHFSTGTKPAVGKEVSVPPGAAGLPGSPLEVLLATLIAKGNLADANRHCELTAAAVSGGRERSWYLNGGIGSGELWTSDVDGEPQVSTMTLRQGATGTITFTCVPAASGIRVGADRDEDGHLNGTDCSDNDAAFFAAPTDVTNLVMTKSGPSLLTWNDQASVVGPSLFYEVSGGLLSDLRAVGLSGASACLTGVFAAPSYNDTRGDPPPGEGFYYLIRARNSECSGGFGASATSIEGLDCSGL
jgi:DNA-binding beta-propeller fold protein YncE/mono/diheme cytochrome c family protein